MWQGYPIQGQLILQQVLYNNFLLIFVVVYQNSSLWLILF